MLIRIPGRRKSENSWRETHSFVFTPEIVGREKEKEEMINKLVAMSEPTMSLSDDEKKLYMVAIVGIAGLGKTTLAKLVFNDPIVAEYFELKIWVCVNDDFDVKLMVQIILQSISKEDVGSLRLEALKNRLHEKISKKRCLLVLDDVWNEDGEKWGELITLLMTVEKGSKIVVTTRNDGVARMKGMRHPVILEDLSKSQSWDLFAKIVFPGGQEKVPPKFLKIGEEVVNMCKGVPLFIKTLAWLVTSKTKLSEWESIKNSRNLLSLGGQNDIALSILKISYNKLSTYNLKQCFAYCALFPKNYKIEKKLLVQMWMAQGYIQDEDLGDRYFKELLSTLLLEVFEKDACDNILSCKMHDLVHDLACIVMRSEFLSLDDKVEEISSNVRHVSLFKPMNLKWKALKVKQVRSFFSIATYYEYKDASEHIIHVLSLDDIIPRIDSLNFKRLRVLSLNGCRKKRLSISLDKLCHLRYLDLSYNDLEKLPKSITQLKCLQTLRVVGCGYLKRFRKDTRELIKLRNLENDGCPLLSHMPHGIGKLTELRSLSVFVVGDVKKEDRVGRLSELRGLNDLRGELSIVKLENVNNVRRDVEWREANLGAKQYLEWLRLEWGRGGDVESESVLEGLGLHPPPNLKGLSIKGYGGRSFPNWMSSRSLRNLAAASLEGCSRCQSLPCFDRFPSLKSLELRDLEKVDYLLDHHHSSQGSFFPSLQKLSLDRMQMLKGLWRTDLPAPPSFPALSQLKLTHCPHLPSLPLPPTPLLSQLEIGNCDQLASLEFHSCHRLSELQIYECPTLTSLLLPPSPLLSHLKIRFCYNLASLRLLSALHLSDLHISLCYNLKSLLLPPTPILSSLKISHCPALKSVQLSSLHSVKTLQLQGLSEEVRRRLMLFVNASAEFVSIE